jgi:hypothetical protein
MSLSTSSMRRRSCQGAASRCRTGEAALQELFASARILHADGGVFIAGWQHVDKKLGCGGQGLRIAGVDGEGVGESRLRLV